MSAPASPPRCQHVWSEADHVCEKCGKVRIAAFPWWVLVYPFDARKRSARAVWLAMWTAADGGTTAPSPVYLGNPGTMLRAGGMSKRRVQDYLSWLQEAGLIRRTDETRRSFWLAWGGPREDWAAEYRANSGTQNANVGTVPDVAPTMPDVARGVTTLAHPHANSGTHTCVVPGFDLGLTSEGDAPATPDPQPTRETRHEQRTDGRMGLGALAAGANPLPPVAPDHGRLPNPHLDTTAQQRVTGHHDNRADLSPEVEAAVRAGRMGGQLLGLTYRKSLLETLNEFDIEEADHAAMVAKVCEYWRTTSPSSKPAKGQVWYGRYRDWQREAMGLGSVRKPKGNGMSGGIVASRPLPDWDGEAERRAAQ